MGKKKLIKRLLIRALVFAIFAFIYWQLAVVFILTGIYDVLRQKQQEKRALFSQYFLVNGTLTWLFSPINTLIDILCLPFINKQVYTLDQLPKIHQKEIRDILENCPKEQLINAVENTKAESTRTLLLYKWYGYNIDNGNPCDLFHKPFKKILTIGVSSFNAQTDTKKHFGWLRAGIRVLVNIDNNVGMGAYIDVNNCRHTWKTDGPLFIFDDTVLHKSCNKTSSPRHCLFIDILRPSLVPFIIKAIFKALGFLSVKIPFFKDLSNWKVI